VTQDGSHRIDRREFAATLAWMRNGTQTMLAAVSALQPPDFDAPTLLPAWHRRTVVAHLARNADALGRLLDWARTGVKNPMYASPQQRGDEIAASQRQSPRALLDDVHSSAARLDTAVNSFPTGRWSFTVRSALGRDIPASEVLWLRAREVWIHAVDLGTTASLLDWPTDFAVALVDDVVAIRRSRGELTDLTLATSDGLTWPAPEPAARQMTGDARELAGWLTNRLDSRVADAINRPALGPWI
jgi:maleylpyruvate isomerase